MSTDTQNGESTNHARLMETLRQIASIANLASIPVSMGAHVFMEDTELKDDLLNILSTGLTALNAPIAADTARQAVRDVRTPDQHGNKPSPGAVARAAAPDIAMRTLPVLEMLIRQAL